MADFFNPIEALTRGQITLASEVGLMQSVFESVANGISIADATTKDMPLIYVNPAFERMTGYSIGEVVGRNCRFLQRGETPQSELAAIRSAIERRRDLRTVLKNYTKDGNVFWNELYLSPVFDPHNRLTHYVGVQNDITARVELQRRIEHMALHDGLTGLANRTLAMDRLQESLNRARRFRRFTALLFIDLDGFKAINDRHGHDRGDELLQAVAANLRVAVRESDCAARIGGDEFLVIASDLLDLTEAEEMMDRIVAAIEGPVILSGKQFFPRASVGLSLYPRDGNSSEELLKAADSSMYLDKQARFEQRQLRHPA
jgi:diguanylate cyclase (GGDEF)-like protein/PAS domain S-box-containing protein